MSSIKSVLICINMTLMDDIVLKYASLFCQKMAVKNIHILHVIKTFDIPERIQKIYGNLLIPIDEFDKKQMQTKVKNYFTNNITGKLNFHVAEGDLLTETLTFIKNHSEIDLMIVGRKEPQHTRRKFIEKLVRKAPCSTLIVPQGASAIVNHIVIPIDFSNYSDDNFNMGIQIARSFNCPKAQCVHVYQVPTGYSKTGLTYDEYSESMKKSLEIHYHEFIKNKDIQNIQVSMDIQESPNPVDIILNYDQNVTSSMIVVGSKGRNLATAILIGSVTEALIWKTQNPIFALKNKDHRKNLIEFLLSNI